MRAIAILVMVLFGAVAAYADGTADEIAKKYGVKDVDKAKAGYEQIKAQELEKKKQQEARIKQWTDFYCGVYFQDDISIEISPSPSSNLSAQEIEALVTIRNAKTTIQTKVTVANKKTGREGRPESVMFYNSEAKCRIHAWYMKGGRLEAGNSPSDCLVENKIYTKMQCIQAGRGKGDCYPVSNVFLPKN